MAGAPPFQRNNTKGSHNTHSKRQNHHPTAGASGQLPVTLSDKKNDDVKGPNSIVGLWQLHLQRWWLHFRTLPVIQQRLWSGIVAILLLMTVLHIFESSTTPSRSTSTTIHTSNPITRDFSYPPRIVQLGPTKVSRLLRDRRGNEEWAELEGAGDVTVASTKISQIPPTGSREISERHNPLPHDAPLLKAASTMDRGKCQQMHEWQGTHNPNCNVVHEASFGFVHPLGWNSDEVEGDFDYYQADEDGTLFSDLREQVRLVAGGAFRWVWMIREYDGTRRALKTLRIDSKTKKFDLRNFDRHRRDAVAMDQLTKSNLIVDMYGFCTNTGLFDWGEGGDLTTIFEEDDSIPSEEHLLGIAYNASMALHDAHNFDDQGRATLAHTDIKPDQFLLSNGYYRLSDFNRVRFLLWNKDDDEPCGFKVAKNGGVWRSPEEYKYHTETEKVDVYSLGNVLYFLLTRTEPWDDETNEHVYRQVQKGKRPEIPQDILDSDSIFHRYMVEAMRMAWTHDQYERPGALAVAQKLKEGILEYGKAAR